LFISLFLIFMSGVVLSSSISVAQWSHTLLPAGHCGVCLQLVPPEWLLYRLLNWPQGWSIAGRIRSIEKSKDLIRNWTFDLPACSIVTQQSTASHTISPRVPLTVPDLCAMHCHKSISDLTSDAICCIFPYLKLIFSHHY
jgi:hypothetical protein